MPIRKIMMVDDEPHILERFADDPWMPMGIIQIESVEPWHVWLVRDDLRR